MPQNPENLPDWFKKLTNPNPGPSEPTEPKLPQPEVDWNELFAAGATEDAPAELPAQQRVAIAQMAAQFQELQRVGFSRLEAFSLIQAQIITAVQVAGEQRFRRGQGGGS